MLNLIQGFHIYGLLVGLGIWLGLEVSIWLGKRNGLKKKVIEEAFIFTVGIGLMGARIYHVIDFWEIYKNRPAKTLYLWEGGLGIFGGLVGGVLGLWIFWKIRKIKVSFLRLLDICVIGVPLAQAIGRWGN